MFAALSFATTLALPYIGEEGIYTITAMEMKLRGQYFINTLYGTNHGQPPLLNWLVIPLADALGWERVLVASRLVAACATIGTGLVLAWLVAALTDDRRFAAFAALVYLTSDALIYHGWLAYTYPLFAFFTFAAIACLWVAATRRSIALAWIAAAAISCAALTKGQSAYPFYAVTALVLLCRHELRGFLLRPGVLLPQLAAAALYFVWHQQLTDGAQQSTDLRMILRESPGVRSCAPTCINCGGFRWKRPCASCPPACSSPISGCARNHSMRRRDRTTSRSRFARGSRASTIFRTGFGRPRRVAMSCRSIRSPPT